MPCGCYYSLPLPHDAAGWSKVCDCGIFWSCSLFFLVPCLSLAHRLSGLHLEMLPTDVRLLLRQFVVNVVFSSEKLIVCKMLC